MKLVAAIFDSNVIVGTAVGPMLQVTPRFEFSLVVGVRKILLFAVTAVVEITQVLPDEFVAQEKAPAAAAPQATRDELAAVPTAAQLVVVANAAAVTEPVK